jgi:glycosyltransferase involved in cell wall biosynthesis
MRMKINELEDIFDNPDVFKFITIGRLSSEKGHKYLIEAFSKVYKIIPNSKLIIIGEGPLRPQLEGLTKKRELADGIIFMGFRENPYKFLSRSDVFVLPSLFEGLPFTLIEALICKIPIISTDCRTGPREILDNGKYGVLTEVANSNDLAEKMIKLTNNSKERERLIENSCKRILEFDTKNFTANWSKLIENCLKEC